jgi:ribosome recycling factor
LNDKDVTKELDDKLQAGKDHFAGELNKLRTGRAHPSMVEGVMVEAYGVQTPMIQLATITTPEPQLIQISPFDPGTMKDIADSIRKNESLGLNPVDDGRVIRIQIPPLTTERRQQIVKQLGEKQEEAMIALRKARHEAQDTINASKKDRSISEDDAKRVQKQVDDAVNAAKADIEEQAKIKEAEILKV